MRIKEDKLVDRIQNGDKRAFKEVYDEYYTQFYFIARRYLKDESLAKDAVQDLFLKFWVKRDKLETSKTVKGFLFVMLKNLLLDMIRKRKTQKKILDKYKVLVNSDELHNTTEEDIIFDQYYELFKQAFKNLTPAQRKVFRMKSFEGLSNAEVADINEVSPNTVKTQFYHASKYIRQYLKKRINI